MARKSLVKVQYRRKRENKTNYYKRLNLLKSDKPRLVVRLMSNTILMQVVKFEPTGDKILASAKSTELKAEGWNYKGSNIPGCYLTGMLLAKNAAEAKITDAILDIGFQTTEKGSRIYSAVKGAIDGGLNVPAGEGIFPDKDRLSGKHIANHNKKFASIQKDFETVKSKIKGSK
jgi:large subunit ribosomal protein L18